MKKIYTHSDPVFLGFIRSSLESQGIECRIKPEHLGGALGEIPFTEVWPELWITQNEDERDAMAIIDSLTVTPKPGGEPWRCVCGELNDSNFELCWACSRSRDDA